MLGVFKSSLTMTPLEYPEIKKQALLLVKEARLADSSIVRFFWFPDAEQVRLLELSSDLLPASGDEVEPVFFRPAPEHGMPALSGVAMIREDEYGSINPPTEWGTWDQAVDLTGETEK